MHKQETSKIQKMPKQNNMSKKKIVAEIPLSSFYLGHLLLCVEVCPDMECIHLLSKRPL